MYVNESGAPLRAPLWDLQQFLKAHWKGSMIYTRLNIC